MTDGKNQLGAAVKLDGAKIRPDALLFGETQSRIIISARPEKATEIEKLCRKNKAPVSRLGTVGKDALKIESLIDLRVAEMSQAWRESIPKAVS
jgi:phosphoribosylformylglycinamidine synthase